ncbi:MAG: efflux RND transporter permease subunit [Deltaproteobacteria bacterium]|nr:efflux RND transporter permease subunit [Deltaproteobacteria bacterium]
MSAVKWMAHNHVAANLLMAVLLLGGIVVGSQTKLEVFPPIELDRISVSVIYPGGAGPKEIEDSIVRPIEEAVSSIDGVDRVISTASEGGGTIVAELLEKADTDTVLQDVKSAVDRITTLPQQAERPVIQKIVAQRELLAVAVYGDLSKRELRQQAEYVRDALLDQREISQVELAGIPAYEISIELSEQTLRSYKLTLPQIATAVRAASIDMPGGTVRTRSGEILLRTKERRYTAREYEDIVIISRPDGTLVRLRDIATVRETFAETDESGLFNGKPAAMVRVFDAGEYDAPRVTAAVARVIKQQRPKLSSAVNLAIWADRSEILRQRFNLLLKNAAIGLLLVAIVLGMFLKIRLAFWVTMGIPVSVMGAIALMPAMGVSFNMISLFAFILVLGIVVDDAIVVGENIHALHEAGMPYSEASHIGAVEVGHPVVFSVLTTMVAFAPLLTVSGMMGKFMSAVPMIVIAVLAASLIESLFVLPAHLNKDVKRTKSRPSWRDMFNRMLRWTTEKPFAATLRWTIKNRYTTVALAIASLLMAGGLVAGGLVKTSFMPAVEGDVVSAKLVMPYGTAVENTERQAKRIISTAQQLIAEFDAQQQEKRDQRAPTSIARAMYAQIGAHLAGFGPPTGSVPRGGHLAHVAIYLQPSDLRKVSSSAFADAWRDRVGEVAGAESLDYSAEIVHMGKPIDIELAHDDFAKLLAAGERVKAALANFAGVSEVTDSYEAGKRELRLKLRPEARALGITQQDLAMQVRSAFYGAEALRLQRGRTAEIKVMVRYPPEQRRSLADVDQLRLRTPAGGEVPFAEAAQVVEGRDYAQIRRVGRKRVLNVSCQLDKRRANADEIMSQLSAGILAKLTAEDPNLTYDLAGQQREQRSTRKALMRGMMMALICIFALLAIPSKSYGQPLIIMSAIPFGLIGAVVGHMLLGYEISMISMFGVVALAGVVVNDSLVLVDRVNRLRARGLPLEQAVYDGARQRFRPIILTTLTTFFALVPMLAETSVQARFLIPMAVSLGFGVLGATVITLVLVPTLYVVLDDLKRLALRIISGNAPTRGEQSAKPVGPPPEQRTNPS